MVLSDSVLGKVRDISRQYHAKRVYLFGSAVESPGTAHDVDLGVEGVPPRSFFRYMGELMDAVPVPLDLVDLDDGTPFSRLVKKYGRIVYDSPA